MLTAAGKQLAKEQAKAKREHLELTFKSQLRAVGISDGWVCNYKFMEGRKFAIDFAWLDKKLAIEIEGGTWINGGHNRGVIFESNCEKYNELAKRGWTLFRFTTGMVTTGQAILFVEDFLKMKGAA
jgi:very-short-patch-repair endonuclease